MITMNNLVRHPYLRLQLATALAIILTMVLLNTSPAMAINASLDMSLGYNDNVAESADRQGSPFCNYAVDIDQPLYANDNRAISGYASANYRDHMRLGDQWQTSAGVSVWQRLFNGSLHATLYADINRYADHVNIEDERDFLVLGSKWQWFLNERSSITCALNYEDSHYRHKNKEESAVTKGHNHNGQTVHRTVLSSRQRNDTLWLVSTAMDYRFDADSSTQLTLSYSDNDSTIGAESYTETGLENHWNYQLTPVWGMELWGSHLWQEYHYGQERNWLASSRVNWQCGNAFTLYIQLEKQWHTTPHNADSYIETVSQCGVIWSY